MILPWSVSVIYILFPGSATLLHTISTNLYFFSKLIEKVVLNQLDLQLSSNNILHPFQSVYPQYWISPSAHSYWSPLGWLWQLLYSHYTWPLSCLQQYWSLCSLWTPSTHFWHYQLCSLSVPFLPVKQTTIWLRSPTRVGPGSDSLHPLHMSSFQHNPVTTYQQPILLRWHHITNLNSKTKKLKLC